MSDIERAKALFESGDYTCVLCKGETVLTSTLSGIFPMLAFIKNDTNLSGYSAADKIVGKAAAMLFVLAGVKEVYASVMSRQAEEVFNRFGILYSCDTLAENIINRNGTGLCPMEEAVSDIDEPQAAFEAIKRTMEALRDRSMQK